MNKIILSLCAGSLLFAGLPVPKTLEADFVQTVESPDTNRTLSYRGHMLARLPGQAKWVYTKPMHKTICLDHDRAWVIEPELEQATLYRLGQSIPLTAILNLAEKIDTHRYVAHYKGIDYDITVDARKRLESVAYDDDLGNRVVLRFENLRTDPVDPDALRCEIPDDYDIIDGRMP